MNKGQSRMTDCIVPVILCGGTGTRLWPLSREDYPKQLLTFQNERSLLQETFLRLSSIPDLAPAIVVCQEMHQFVIKQQLKEIGINDAVILLEPEGKNTAPATTIAALTIQSLFKINDPVMLVLPADHIIKQTDKFCEAVVYAKEIVSENFLITFGITPERAETGYGYIKKGSPFKKGFQVEKFVEKPTQEVADEYLKSGNYFWNSGMFMFRCSAYLNAIEEHAPSVLDNCKKSINNTLINSDIYKNCPSISLDYAVMEKSQQVAMIPLDAGWNDLGSWKTWSEAKDQDNEGNNKIGDIYTHDVKNSYLHAENRLLAVLGVHDHIVIETADTVFVAHKNYSEKVKTLVNELKNENRPELKMHRFVHRPWGYFQVLEHSSNFQVKRLTLNSHAHISLQKHQHRSEHWVVVQGVAEVIRGEETFNLHPNQSTYIPAGVIHRLKNSGTEKLIVIEVQTGSYLGEDDIVRFEEKEPAETCS